MDVIVCTVGVGNVLRISVCTSPTALEAEVLWSRLEFVMMVALSSKFFKEHWMPQNTETIFLILSFCPFCNIETLITSTWQQDFLNQNHIRVLPWPALSLDLTPIENLLDELGRRVRHRQSPPETLQELRDAHVHEWNNIPQPFIQRLIGSMRRRCEVVVAARGGHTRYWTRKPPYCMTISVCP